MLNFQLHLPITITRYGRQLITWKGTTEEVSGDEISFYSEFAPKIGCRVEYTVLLHNVSEPVILRAMGIVRRVLRWPTKGDSRVFRVTVTIDRRRITRLDTADRPLQRTQLPPDRFISSRPAPEIVADEDRATMTAREFMSAVDISGE